MLSHCNIIEPEFMPIFIYFLLSNRNEEGERQQVMMSCRKRNKKSWRNTPYQSRYALNVKVSSTNSLLVFLSLNENLHVWHVFRNILHFLCYHTHKTSMYYEQNGNGTSKQTMITHVIKMLYVFFFWQTRVVWSWRFTTWWF